MRRSGADDGENDLCGGPTMSDMTTLEITTDTDMSDRLQYYGYGGIGYGGNRARRDHSTEEDQLELTAEWTLQEALDCGWTVKQHDGSIVFQADMMFGSSQLSSTPMYRDFKLARLQCHYETEFDISTTFDSQELVSVVTGNSGNFAPSFELELVNSDGYKRNAFTVGEQITAKVQILLDFAPVRLECDISAISLYKHRIIIFLL